MLPDPYRIEKAKRETRDTFTLHLAPVNCGRPFHFSPGQFNMLYQFGIGEVPISISGDPVDPDRLVHTIRAVGPVTKAMQRLKPGATLGVRGPYGRGWPVQEAAGSDVLFVAGGIGLAPLRPAMYYVLAHRQQYGRVVLLYGTRTSQDILYLSEIEGWRARFDLDVHVTVDTATREWRGDVGVVTKLISRAPCDPFSSVAFVCGPEVMMRFTALELRKAGIELTHVYISMERNMKCGVGLCGHCQFGPTFICKDGPVYPYENIKELLTIREI
jgi:NAD(P)H-flavin reductase